MKKCLLAAALLTAFCLTSNAQVSITNEFKPLMKTVDSLVEARTSVKNALKINSVKRRGQYLDFYFNESLGNVPWRAEDKVWLEETLKGIFPDKYSNCKVGELYCKGIKLREILLPPIHSDGRPHDSKFRTEDPRGRDELLVARRDGQYFGTGMSGRTVALWQSHGLYYHSGSSRWIWQRAKNFSTVEDMFTQSFVLPFLIPMLENAGAYVMTPRERDIQKYESICDNDPAFTNGRTELVRTAGKFSVTGHWKDAGTGFGDISPVYVGDTNPFECGTAIMTQCNRKRNASVTWTADIPKRGQYAVYISYKSLPESTTAARYTVHSLNGDVEFHVNQSIGGGTWIYLGTFDFDEGDGGYVTLDNGIPEGRTSLENCVVTADAVRFGGGMGKIARGQDDEDPSEYVLSGVPAYMEGALYNMQWGGADTSITRRFDGDYTNDYADRGAWVGWMDGGSRVNPKEKGLGIPVDMTLAFHTDAGVTPNDNLIGTLAIYTLLCDGKRVFANGEKRLAAREYTDLVQTQIVNDLRASFDTTWRRRQIWDRSYSESRTTTVPGMLLELLSHQNFADMKFGLDPAYRFIVSRSVYKGMLKFLSNRYGCRYTVQPLPVRSFAADLGDGKVSLKWKPTEDVLEPTAVPTGYILYTRVDGGAFDTGIILDDFRTSSDGIVSCDVPIEAGHIYSFKIEAYNDGGRSFPSEILSAGIAPGSKADRKVLVVNNFDRVSAPAWFDTPEYAGFNEDLDGGVPYIKDITYIGKMYEFRRQLPWTDDDNPGFGASFCDMAGFQKAGNTFDFPYIHGESLLALGYSFASCSHAAFEDGTSDKSSYWTADIICGKQVTTPAGTGNKPDRFIVFPESLQKAMRSYTSAGGNLIVSGANIGTDIWDMVYPVKYDSTARAAAKTFVSDVMGWKWTTNHASRLGTVKPAKNAVMDMSTLGEFTFVTQPNELIYNVETPDGISPSGKKAMSVLRYPDTNISAGVCFTGAKWRTVTFGFPIEVVTDRQSRDQLLGKCLEIFEKK